MQVAIAVAKVFETETVQELMLKHIPLAPSIKYLHEKRLMTRHLTAGVSKRRDEPTVDGNYTVVINSPGMQPAPQVDRVCSNQNMGAGVSWRNKIEAHVSNFREPINAS